MKYIFTLIFIAIILSCSNDDDNQNSNFIANATVKQLGIDCGDAWLIQLDTSADDVPNDFENIFYEINLPDEYKVENLEINISYRQPENDEMMNCTDLGIGYPSIFIVRVNE